jgi:hypothetical protein
LNIDDPLIRLLGVELVRRNAALRGWSPEPHAGLVAVRRTTPPRTPPTQNDTLRLWRSTARNPQNDVVFVDAMVRDFERCLAGQSVH